MVNWKLTHEAFDREPNKAPGLKFIDVVPASVIGEERKEDNWFASVKKPDGEYIQIEDLKAAGAVPADFKSNEKPKKYPIKTVSSILRIKKADGTEWLTSRQELIGLDRLGNEVMKTFVDPEAYDKPVFQYQNVRVDKDKQTMVNDPFPKYERLHL